MDRLYLFGFNEKPILRDGWYDPERFEGGPLFRATAAEARLFLGERDVDEVILICSARPTLVGEPLRAALLDRWERTTPIVISTDAWHIRRYVPLRHGQVVGDLKIVVENPWWPGRAFGCGDRRSVGLLVSAVRLLTQFNVEKNSRDHEPKA